MSPTESTWTLAATCCAFDAGIMDFLDDPRSAEEVIDHVRHLPAQLVDALLDVLTATGRVNRAGVTFRVTEATRRLLRSPYRATVLADMKSALLQPRCLLWDGQRDDQPFVPWQHTDPNVLEAQGAGGTLLAELISESLVPSLRGLAAALGRSGAAFLDVGAGVARLSIAMAERWPALRVVGLEPWLPAAQLACSNVAAAGVTERVEIHGQRIETLTARSDFDLAWLPAPFIAEGVLREAIVRVHDALRVGGWLVVGITVDSGDQSAMALSRLVTATWGGSTIGVEEGRGLLVAAGLGDAGVAALPNGPTVLVARKLPLRAAFGRQQHLVQLASAWS